MSYPPPHPPAKRQRSNTSRESVNNTPQTTAPALRQAQVNPNIALYSPNGYSNGGYAAQAAAHQNVNYAPYPSAAVTAQNGYGGGYPTTTAYGAGPYSPQPQPQHQPNTYTTQYPQPQPSPQLPSLSGHYAQPGVNGVHNGGYGQPQVSQPGSRGPYSPVPTNHHQTPTYHQPQSRDSPSLIQHTQHSLPQYGEAYTSQSSAHANSYQATATPYPDPTINPQYNSPIPLPTPQHDSRQISEDPNEDLQDSIHEDMHDHDHDHEDEDAQGETADESSELYPNPELSRTSVPLPTPSTDQSKPPDNRCACKKGRGKKKACISCVCSKYGLNCSSACSCGSACGNPFADLTAFFGPMTNFPKPCGPNACFATWLSNQPNIEELDMDLMVDMLLYDDASWASIREYTESFKKWEQSWKKARGGKGKKNRDERERLEFELLRGGLGNCNQNDFNGFWYSFCQRKWVPTDLWEHCQECRECKPSVEWHCDKHERCTTDRVCPECAATGPYQDMMSYPEPGS